LLEAHQEEDSWPGMDFNHYRPWILITAPGRGTKTPCADFTVVGGVKSIASLCYPIPQLWKAPGWCPLILEIEDGAHVSRISGFITIAVQISQAGAKLGNVLVEALAVELKFLAVFKYFVHSNVQVCLPHDGILQVIQLVELTQGFLQLKLQLVFRQAI